MRSYNVNLHNQVFTAKTKNNNNYEKANVGKYTGFGLGLGCIAERLSNNNNLKDFVSDYHRDLANSFGEEIKTLGYDIEIKGLNTIPSLKKIANQNVANSVAILMLGCVGSGAIIDFIINSEKRAKADGKRF